MRVLRTRRARQDLIDIWRHIGGDDPAAADRLLDRIDAPGTDLVRAVDDPGVLVALLCRGLLGPQYVDVEHARLRSARTCGLARAGDCLTKGC
jgi:hypothetical protein